MAVAMRQSAAARAVALHAKLQNELGQVIHTKSVSHTTWTFFRRSLDQSLGHLQTTEK